MVTVGSYGGPRWQDVAKRWRKRITNLWSFNESLILRLGLGLQNLWPFFGRFPRLLSTWKNVGAHGLLYSCGPRVLSFHPFEVYHSMSESVRFLSCLPTSTIRRALPHHNLNVKALFKPPVQGSLYYQPKQGTIIVEIRQKLPYFALFDSKKIGNLMTPAVSHSKSISLQEEQKDRCFVTVSALSIPTDGTEEIGHIPPPLATYVDARAFKKPSNGSIDPNRIEGCHQGW